jgi:putative nucleotidyltransferase with HDIG domain
MDYRKAKSYVFKKLKRELSPDLHYHCVSHTKDVIKAVTRLGKMEKVTKKELTLLKTAALFHDIGFTETYDGHEKAGAAIARKTLPQFDYSDEDIKAIEGMILATEIPQNPKTHLEKILADADLDYIGRDDFFVIGQRLQYEWKLRGITSSLKDWHEKQLDFLKNHKYFTKAAKMLREETKQHNIYELEKLLCKK